MSRYVDSGKDERGRYILETLADEDGCRWEYNGVCCNDECELCPDIVTDGDCSICLHFQRETQEDIERLKDGVKDYGKY